VALERSAQPRAGHRDPEAGVSGQGQRWHPHDRVLKVVVGALQRASWLGRDDHRLVTADTGEVLGHAQHAMRDPVHIRREGLGDYRDPHDHTLDEAMLENGL
jgi:hypothetical protein